MPVADVKTAGVGAAATGRSRRRRYGDATEPALREQVAGALVNKSVTLGALGRSDEALVVYDDVLARYGDATEPALREIVDLLRGAGGDAGSAS